MDRDTRFRGPDPSPEYGRLPAPDITRCGGSALPPREDSLVCHGLDQEEEPVNTKDSSPGGIRLTPRTVLGIVIGVLALAFIFQNRTQVSTQLLVFEFGAPLWITLLIVFVAGAAVGWLVKRSRT